MEKIKVHKHSKMSECLEISKVARNKAADLLFSEENKIDIMYYSDSNNLREGAIVITYNDKL
ncbi:MAG: hypothetical protein AB8U25_00865 [Rickettsiales endosymbiont of Dermacentor nuttalli]